ncbi:MAG: hypothetical protein F4114_08840 [Rhodospirillaceae bacterium]|nr:hypothetical protein [Rhodospirillaceae bacterium]MDE0702105.1 hypothetical protein [Rhodospirillaceae bacterium]MXW91010.1 hypothetical protein [Rhodospirillaceae bacterium]MYB12407.1 hypothetical protein [Rhodospirillaceae bacterium]MYI49179.1 hypothetical protein [Rhodospirillaceae bacterium]
MIVVRMLAWLLLLIGICLFGHAAVELLKSGAFEPVVFAQIWLWIDQSAQLGFSHFLERNLGAGLHHAVLIPYFWGAAAYAVFLVPGALLWMVSRPRY